MEFTNLLAAGEKMDVYKCGNMAVKLFHTDYAKGDVLYEALVHARVEETGLNVPKILEVAKEKDQWIIAMECIEGKTLAQIMAEDPANMASYLEQMLDLQLEVHSKRAPSLNKLKDKLIADIKALTEIDDNRKYELLTRLDSMPKHVKLCHGNFCPSNIMVQGDKVYIVDWIAATQGNASADVARTYLLLALESQANADLYLDLFCKKTGTAKKYVQEWLPIVAAAHLKNCKPEEKELLMRWQDVVDYE